MACHLPAKQDPTHPNADPSTVSGEAICYVDRTRCETAKEVSGLSDEVLQEVCLSIARKVLVFCGHTSA